MFPLEHTVAPTAVVPLHIFEPRYRALAAAVTSLDEPEFGIAPIERGREVGGEDVRADVAVVARVVDFEEYPDGRWALIAVATRRLRVIEWLTDDPYPRARVEDWPDDDADRYVAQLGDDPLTTMTAELERIGAAVARLQPDHPVDVPTLSDDPAQATWEAAGFAQLNSLDTTTLLRTPGAAERLHLAEGLVRERAEMLEALADERG
ncbi:MAG: LON peptidase substrate-binding domain-containing protein [Acidimicrobiales bacterium]